MAYATEISNSTQSNFGALLTSVRDRLERRRMYKKTLRELNSLGDRELADLGLNRSMIRRVAFQATRA